MSHYKPYPAYKDSGVEWLGRVPEHWECARFDAKTTTHRDSIEAVRLDGLRVLHYSIPAVQEFGCAQEEDGSEIDSSKLVVSQRQLLVSKLNPHKQTLVVADKSENFLSIASTEFVPLIPVSTNLGYITYVWSSVYCQHYLLARCESSTRSHQRVAPSDITRMSWVWPDIEEQAAIGRVLDRETAHIDALIEKKTRFIELLCEKRQALITHAVTKGLDPNVKMKDSGVEWLGEVPEHWEVLQLRHTARLESGHTPSRSKPEYWVDCTVPWFTLADVWQVRSGEQKYVSETSEMVSQLGLENSSARLLPAGSVFLSRTASVGFTGIMAVDMATSQDFAVWTCTSELFNEYLYYVLLGMKPDFDRLMMGSTHKTIYMPDIEAIRIARPPVDEQRGIVSVLSGQLGRFKSVIDKTGRSIELLRERRSALITAAVTGQIDLREAV